MLTIKTNAYYIKPVAAIPKLDKRKSNGQPRGEAHARSKLSNEERNRMIELRPHHTLQQLAAMFGISAGRVGAICKGESY